MKQPLSRRRRGLAREDYRKKLVRGKNGNVLGKEGSGCLGPRSPGVRNAPGISCVPAPRSPELPPGVAQRPERKSTRLPADGGHRPSGRHCCAVDRIGDDTTSSVGYSAGRSGSSGPEGPSRKPTVTHSFVAVSSRRPWAEGQGHYVRTWAAVASGRIDSRGNPLSPSHDNISSRAEV
jgi:hypothetical protein